MSRIEVGPPDPGAERAAALRRAVERSFGADEAPIALSDAPKRVMAVGARRLVIGTVGWMTGTSLRVHLLDRMDGMTLTIDARGVSMIQLHYGPKDVVLTRYGGGDLDVVADGLAEALAMKGMR